MFWIVLKINFVEEVDLGLLEDENIQNDQENENVIQLKSGEEINEDESANVFETEDEYKNSNIETLKRKLNMLKAQILILKKNNKTQHDKKELSQLRSKMTLITKNMFRFNKKTQ